MLEIMIERWSNLDGTTEFMWSVWRDGRRIGLGGAHATADAAEAEALAWCEAEADGAPDSVIRL